MVSSGSSWSLLLFTTHVLYVPCQGGLLSGWGEGPVDPFTGMPIEGPTGQLDPITGLPIDVPSEFSGSGLGLAISDQSSTGQPLDQTADPSSPLAQDTSATGSSKRKETAPPSNTGQQVGSTTDSSLPLAKDTSATSSSKQKENTPPSNTAQDKRESAKAIIHIPTIDVNTVDHKTSLDLVDSLLKTDQVQNKKPINSAGLDTVLPDKPLVSTGADTGPPADPGAGTFQPVGSNQDIWPPAEQLGTPGGTGADILPPVDPDTETRQPSGSNQDIWPPAEQHGTTGGAGHDVLPPVGPGAETWQQSGGNTDMWPPAESGPTDASGTGTDLPGPTFSIPGIDGVPSTRPFVDLAKKAGKTPEVPKVFPNTEPGVSSKAIVLETSHSGTSKSNPHMDTTLPKKDVFDKSITDPLVKNPADTTGAFGTGVEKPFPQDSDFEPSGQRSHPDNTVISVGGTQPLTGGYDGRRPDTSSIDVGDRQSLQEVQFAVLVDSTLNQYRPYQAPKNWDNQNVFPRKQKGNKRKQNGNNWKRKGANAANSVDNTMDIPGLGTIDFSSSPGESSPPNPKFNGNRRGRKFKNAKNRRIQSRKQRKLERIRKRKQRQNQRQQQRQRKRQQAKVRRRGWKPAVNNPRAVEINPDGGHPEGGLITPTVTSPGGPIDVGPARGRGKFKRGGRGRRKNKPKRRRRIGGNRARLAAAPKDVAVGGDGQAKPEPVKQQEGKAEPSAGSGSALAEEEIVKIPGFGSIDFSTPYEGEAEVSV